LQHWTRPPPHYSEASLIQLLEKEGIGRPSTFASIIDTLLRRQYAEREKRTLRATALGTVVADFLVGHFPSVLDVAYTARMEEQLDEISNGRARWQAVTEEMWGPLSQQVAETEAILAGQKKVPVPGFGYTSRRRRKSGARPKPKETGEACPQCGESLVERKSKYGPFIGCSGYPTCRYIRKDGD
jgi:DNA topoisomerase-1